MTGTYQAAIRLKTDGGAEARAEVASVGQAADAAQQRILASTNLANAASDAQLERWRKMAQAAKEAEAIAGRQSQFNAFMGIGGSGKSAAESAAVFESMLPANGNAKLSTTQFQELAHSARAFFDELMAGGSPTRALAMESGRLAQTMGQSPGGVGATFKALGVLALEWAGPAGIVLAVAGGVALLVSHFHAAKVEAEELKKAQEGLTQTQHAGMEAINHAIEFSEKYHVSSTALYGSLEHVITSQGTMNDVVKRGIGVTDDMARAARDRAEAERLLTVEMLRQAAAEAGKRADAAKKKLGGFLGIPDQANIQAVLVGIGTGDVAAVQQAHDDYIHAHLDPLKKVVSEEQDLQKTLLGTADSYSKATLTVKVRNQEAEAGARKAEEAARKAAAEEKKRMEQELLLEALRIKNLLEIARLRGDKKLIADIEQEQHAQELVNEYIRAGLTEEQARHEAALENGKQELALSQGRAASFLEEAKGMKTLAQLTVDWSKLRPANENQDALDSFMKTEITAFDTLGNKLTDTQGKMKSWGETMTDVISQVISDFEKLAVLNPLENFLFGQSGLNVSGYQNKPSISGIGSFFTSLFSGGHNADGTENWQGGWTEVGERGPEKVWLPQGSKVFSSVQSGSMGGVVINMPIDARGADPASARNIELQVHQLRAELPGLVVQYANDGLSRGRIKG